MTLSTLERQINDFEGRSDWLESWLGFWITCVVLGLIIEVMEVIWHHFHEDGKKTAWTLTRALLGPVLIAVGVAGELYVHFVGGHTNAQLRNANRQAVALLNKQAGDARAEAARASESAGEANERAGIANKEAAEANARAKQYEGEIAKANVGAAVARKESAEANERAKKYESTISEANARSAEAERRAAEASLELAKFKAPRTLGAEQRKRLAEKAIPYSGQKFSIAVSGDPEAIRLAEVIEEVLTSAGWKREVYPTPILLRGRWGIIPTEGLIIQFSPRRTPRVEEAGVAVSRALIAEGFATKAELNAALDANADRVIVIVGKKP